MNNDDDQRSDHLTVRAVSKQRANVESSPYVRDRVQEQQANAFAMALLMPEGLLRDELHSLKFRHGTGNEDVILKSLAKKFQVSQTLMASRLIDLGMLIAP